MSVEQGPAMIEAVGLSKYYGDFAAIEDVTFSIPKGQVVAFLGPNGAGKSTTMKLLTGYLAPSAGTARIAGHDMATDRLAGSAKLGYLPENGPLYPDMTPRSLLEFFADARGLTGAYKQAADRKGRRAVRAGQRDRQGDRQALEGLSAARGHGPGAAARARRADPRRADRRARSRTRSATCATRSAGWARARRSCSRPTFCKRSRRSPAACCSSTKAGWCTTAPVERTLATARPRRTFPRADGQRLTRRASVTAAHRRNGHAFCRL